MPGTGFLAMRCQPHYYSLVKSVYSDSLRHCYHLGESWKGVAGASGNATRFTGVTSRCSVCA